jgi:hypothetical protein
VITGAILSMLATVFGALISVLPGIPVPSWLNASGPIGTVFADAGTMGVWFPVGLIVTVLTSLLAIWLLAFGVKAARIVVSLFTGGGGSAA